jgi:hypothetical protein
LVLTSQGEQGAQEEAQLYRRVVVRFTPRAADAADVLDLPLPPKAFEADTPPAPATRAVRTPKRPQQPVRAWVLGLDPTWRRPAGAAVVAVGAACGAGVGLGLCCVAPFTAPLGVSVAAGALDEVAEPDAFGGAGVGALIGGVLGAAVLAGAGPAVNNVSPVAAVALIATVPTLAIAGAAVGAAAWWWNSPSGRALVAEVPLSDR